MWQVYCEPGEQMQRFRAQELTADLVLLRSVAFNENGLPALPGQVDGGGGTGGAAAEDKDVGSDVGRSRLRLAALLDLYGPDFVVYGDLVREGGFARADDVFYKCTEEAEAAFYGAGRF